MIADEFISKYPEFRDIAVGRDDFDSAIQNELDFSDEVITKVNFRKFRDKAVCLLTAHRLTLRFKVVMDKHGLNSVSLPGVVVSHSASAGGLSLSANVSEMVSSRQAFVADLSRTNYGLELLSLMDSVISPMVLVTSNEGET